MRFIPTLIVATTLAGTWLAVAPGEAQGQRRQRDRITREEILASAQRDLDLYEAVKALRPRFLERPRGVRTLGGSTPPNPLMIVVDRKRIGGAEALQSIRAQDVQDVRYLDPAQAESEYGAAGNGGVIVVTLYKAPAAPPPAPPVPPPAGRG